MCAAGPCYFENSGERQDNNPTINSEQDLISLILLAVLAICVLVQLYYALLYFLPLSRYTDPEPDTHRPVSVIVAAHNEQDNLFELLPMLLGQE